MDSKNHRLRSLPSTSHRRPSLSNSEYVLPSGEPCLRQVTHPELNGVFKDHNEVNFKLIKIVAEFTNKLSSAYEQHADQLLMLVETFRKRNAELRRERPPYHSSLFTSWEVLLQEVEVDSQIHGDISRSLGRQVGVILQERTFHRKIQAQKVFLHRESFETILRKAEELLEKCHQDYTDSYNNLITHKNHAKLAEYYDMHNAYVQQLHATNGMLDHYYRETLPRLLDELEEIYSDLSENITNSVFCCADLLVTKAREQCQHYENIVSATQAVKPRTDITSFIRSLNIDRLNPPVVKHPYNPPYMENDPAQTEAGMLLRNELVIDRLSQLPNRSSTLKQDVVNLEGQIRQLSEAIDSLERMQKRSLESNLFNKANELQAEISLKKFDLQVAYIHLSAVRAQLDLFANSKGESLDGNNLGQRKQSTTSTGSTAKNKWLKAILNLKSTSSGSLDKSGDKKAAKSGSRPLSAATVEPMAHIFQEYTYKKVSACDHCNEIFKGHTRQGLKCKMCRMNVHADCQSKVGPCNPKPRFLRRQKSTSEIEVKALPPPEPEARNRSGSIDPVYQLLKQAGDLGGNPKRSDKDKERDSREKDDRNKEYPGSNSSSLTSLQHNHRWPRSNASSSASSSSSYLLQVSGGQPKDQASTSAPHSPQSKRLSLRVKSFSLDSPESSEHVHRRTQQQQPPHLHQLNQTLNNSSQNQYLQSPVHGSHRHLAGKNVRMSSVDLPDENEKSLSSESISPCPSPKHHRLLPTNLYVVLYNFRGRHQDETDLKAGYIITVTDTSDPDWWQGKCMGRIGYFPSKYVTKLHPGEQPLQVTHSVHVNDGVKLLSDQIVIQIGEEKDGMVMIRTGADDKVYSCPKKCLKEV